MLSIVTIVLNQVNEIENTLLSVIEQRTENCKIQYIVIDGGSIDGTLEIINKYSNKIDIIVSGKDGGIFQAVNKGISMCKHPLVGLIHCGDKYLPGVLSKVYEKFEKCNSDVLFGDMSIKTQISDKIILQYAKPNLDILKTKMSIFHPSTFIKLDVYKKNGLYDISYKSSSDYDYILKLYLRNHKFTYMGLVVSEYAAGGNSEINTRSILRDNYLIRLRNLGISAAIIYLIKFKVSHFYFNSRKKALLYFLGEDRYNGYKIKYMKSKNVIL